VFGALGAINAGDEIGDLHDFLALFLLFERDFGCFFLPLFLQVHTHKHIYIYIYIYTCISTRDYERTRGSGE
jgi:hypothetical protein